MARILVESINVGLSVQKVHSSIKATEFPLLEVAVVAKDVQHLRHLGEYQSLVTVSNELDNHSRTLHKRIFKMIKTI